MASTNGRPDAPLSDQLFHEPYRFDFFQAVRLLERLARGAGRRAPQPVGHDHPPDQEAVRFRAHNSLSFPAAPIQQLQWAGEEGQTTRPPEMTVNFMGLTGPSGVLPFHYTRLLIQRLRLKDQRCGTSSTCSITAPFRSSTEPGKSTVSLYESSARCGNLRKT